MLFRKFFTLLVFFISSISTAHATFHSWEINELFSNDDGTIQFIELFEAKGDDDSHLLFSDDPPAELSSTSTDGSITHSMMFPNDLPSNLTANKFFLIATSGFASLAGAVMPDYIMADSFLFIGGGTVDFGLGVSEVIHGILPTDGILSLNLNVDSTGVISTVTNSPTNFAGAVGSIDVSAVVPVPAAVWLFSSGLIGMVAVARRRKTL